MAKITKKKAKNEPISISQIYETIKDRNFLQDLWWDLISDIKEKPTYKRIWEMVDNLLSDKLSCFATEPMDSNEQLKRRTALTEISIMTYTVDTVISEVLYRKLQNEFQSMVSNIVEEIQSAKRNKEIILQSSPNSVFEDIESIFENDENEEGNLNTKGSNCVSQPKCSTNNAMHISNNGIEESTPLKRGRPTKKRLLVKKTFFRTTPSPRKSAAPVTNINNHSSTPKKTVKKSVKKENAKSDKNESDSDSVMSRISNISSVHTSELSSFEDTISIESGDDGRGRRKKQIPLKVVNDMYIRGKLSEICRIDKNGNKKRKRESPGSPDVRKLVESNTSPRKQLPHRIRKPNSRYSSDTMYCEVKNYSKSQHEEFTLTSSDDEIDIMTVEPKEEPKRKRKVSNNKMASRSPRSRKDGQSFTSSPHSGKNSILPTL